MAGTDGRCCCHSGRAEVKLAAALAFHLAGEFQLHRTEPFAGDVEGAVLAERDLPPGRHHDVDVRVRGVAVLGRDPRRQLVAGSPVELIHGRARERA